MVKELRSAGNHGHQVATFTNNIGSLMFTAAVGSQGIDWIRFYPNEDCWVRLDANNQTSGTVAVGPPALFVAKNAWSDWIPGKVTRVETIRDTTNGSLTAHYLY